MQTLHLFGVHCCDQQLRSTPLLHFPCILQPISPLFSAAFFVLYHAVSQQRPQLGNTGAQLNHLPGQLQQQSNSSKSDSATQRATPSQGKQGDPNLTTSQRAVRIGIYLWLSLLNLVATSTLWATAADAFDSNAAKRLFGFLGAGATLGSTSPLPPQ